MDNKERQNKSTVNNIKTLGWVAFFGGLSQDMIQPILPTFYTQILGLSKETVGLIEGSVTTIVSIMRIVSGIISDKLGKRKSIVFIGYLFSAIGRIFLSLTNGAAMTFGLRFTDGIGKGLKDAPRDALVAKSSEMKNMGYSFGFQRMLDTLGSFIGPLITTGLMVLLAKYIDETKYRIIFLVAGLIGFITILLIGLFVVERKGDNVSTPFKFDFTIFKGKFLLFFIVMLIFTLGNSSDAFLILRARNVGVSSAMIPIIIAMFNLFYALLSVPSGILSDKIGRVNVIKIGWLIYAVTYLGFALARVPWHIWILYAIYGIYYSTTEGVAKSLVAHLVDENNRGTAFGLYNASIGILALPASFIAGYLWDKVAPSAPFYFGAGCSILAVIFITIFRIEK
ncbi:major facilitator superfamily MFS_1 [Thermoanaerobacterium xylanolyticum LX-11]|uniref:Major facilitator superfamily MFS_1 n=1 Tax=Thermoanaerobacterium xylanolyticum (strain ATCC 49914 / DSM 7097 / LX-11) TaxID=858215 RepID=F6BHY3_THEXL|nr:MFS transporter [Thermoanaerobacterium xylanolyticum]AEF16652.1 major facilitator superfamily MFS_1 [Thermoanaerobacterium xylanolyticum LX-11]